MTADPSGAALLTASVDETWVAGVRRYARESSISQAADGASSGGLVEAADAAAAAVGTGVTPRPGGGMSDPYSAGRHGPTRPSLAIGAAGCPCCSGPAADFGRMLKMRGGRRRK